MVKFGGNSARTGSANALTPGEIAAIAGGGVGGMALIAGGVVFLNFIWKKIFSKDAAPDDEEGSTADQQEAKEKEANTAVNDSNEPYGSDHDNDVMEENEPAAAEVPVPPREVIIENMREMVDQVRQFKKLQRAAHPGGKAVYRMQNGVVIDVGQVENDPF